MINRAAQFGLIGIFLILLSDVLISLMTYVSMTVARCSLIKIVFHPTNLTLFRGTR